MSSELQSNQKSYCAKQYIYMRFIYKAQAVRVYVVLMGILSVLSSCVTNKNFNYLQLNDVNPAKGQLPKDTVLRSYASVEFDYRLKFNDLVSVRFESLTPGEYDFLSTGNQPSNAVANLTTTNAIIIGELIDEGGDINVPHFGKVKAAGFTVFELQNKLQDLAEQYLQSPVVKVRLLNYRATILGEVNREGTITFSNNRVSIFEALGLSGGLTDLADKRNIKLIREKDGKVDVVYLDLLDERFIESPYYYLHQNDIILAGALRQRPFRKYFGQNFALVVSSVSLLILAISVSR